MSGRAVPWWLAGLSMVATTFSSDTPNLVTDIVRRNGVAGNWVWWAFVLTGVSTVFFYARLWRRSGVMTDLEFYEIRYSGAAARGLRGFRAIYLGLLFNCMIMATVNLAACKIASVLFGLERWQTLLAVGVLNVVFAAHSGLWGVLVIDMIQFFIKMSAVIAAAYFAVNAPQVGGLDALIAKLSATPGPGGINYLNILPDFTNNWDLAVAVFIMPIAVQWWAVWYPGAEPGGGSYVAQRMLASKSERDALGAVLFFNVAHYVLRPWPWILVALASIIVYPELSDIQRALPHVDPQPDRPRHRVSGDAQVPAGGVHRADGRRPDRRELVDDPHAPELGRVVPRPRLLPPVRPPRRRRAALRARRPHRDGAAVRLLVGDGLPARHGQGRVRHHPADRRRHGPALPGALVLVARERVVRDRRDDQLVRHVGRCSSAWCATAPAISTHAALLITIAVTTVSLAARRVPGAADRSRRAEGVLPQGPPVRPGLGARFAPRPGRCETRRDRARTSRWRCSAGSPGSMAIWSALFAVGNYLYGRTGYAVGADDRVRRHRRRSSSES